MWPINLTDFKKKIAVIETDFEKFIPAILLKWKYYHLNRIFMTTKEERVHILLRMRKYAHETEDEEKKKLMKNLIIQTIKDSRRFPKEGLNADQEEWCRKGVDIKYLERSQERKQDFWDGEIWYKFQHNMLPISLEEYLKTAKILRVSKEDFEQFILGIFEFFAEQGHPKRFEEVFIASPEETQYWNDELDTLEKVRKEVRNIVPPEEGK